MEWWGWLLVVLAVLAVLFLAFVVVQRSRRSGGVVVRRDLGDGGGSDAGAG